MIRAAQLGLLAVALAVVGAAGAATLLVGPKEKLRTVAEAAQAARDGDTIEITAGTYVSDVAVFEQRALTLRAVGGRVVLDARGRVAEGKAIWVFRDGEFDVSGITFTGARADDRNGAGIRFEHGRLRVRDCTFEDNENGILTSNDTRSELIVENSEFSRAPRDRGQLKHLIYVGRIARFTMTGSRVHQGFEGHLVKSRARTSDIRYNLLVDGPDGRAAYELEFPNGGVAYVIGNVIGQSATTTNPTVVSYGAEGAAWPENRLYLSQNTLLSDASPGAWFLRVWDEHFGGGLRVVAVNNLTVGPGLFTLAAHGEFSGNFPAASWMLSGADILDFRLSKRSLLRGIDSPAPNVDGVSLAPSAEFTLPRGTRPLGRVARWTPGAFQDADPRD